MICSLQLLMISAFPEVKGANEMDQTAVDDDDADEGSEDEDESDLDLAWKMLDLARAIVEKNPEDTLEKVDILSALGEVALERGFLFLILFILFVNEIYGSNAMFKKISYRNLIQSSAF